MSGEVRLHGPTLRHAAMLLRRPDPLVGDRIRKVADLLADSFDLVADVCDALPPRLSDWVRACEGTALGEPQVIPSWELPPGLAGDFAHVDFIEAIGSADVVVTSYVKPTYDDDDGCRETRTRCTTPAELRAALEALAADTGAPR